MASIKVRETTLFDGYAGWKHGGAIYRLACAPDIVQAPNGDLLVTWLTGADKEPATDNGLAMARSTDGGATWGEPVLLVPADNDNGAGAPYTVGDHMVALLAKWPCEHRYTVWNYYRSESTDNGHAWSEPAPFSLTDGREGFSVSLSRPIFSTRQGGWVFPACTFERRARPFVASAFDLAHAADEAEAARMPPCPDGEAAPGKFSTHRHGVAAVWADPEMQRFRLLGGVANRPLGLLEPTMVELADGTLVMLMRAEWGGFLWRSDSADGGLTWSPAVQTDIPNPTTKPYMMRLPDGRIALFHNAAGGVVGRKARRDPLSIWISDDELNSWSVREDVITGDQLAYPDAKVLADGRIAMVYDRDRRTVQFVEVIL